MHSITKLMLLAAVVHAPAAMAADKPSIAKVCMNCHKAEEGSLRGYFDGAAFKSRSIQLRIDDRVEIVRFDPESLDVVNGTEDGADALKEVKKAHEVKISFVEVDGVKTATAVIVKPALTVPPEMLITTAEVAKLVAAGPEKAGYALIDSRPPPRYQEGYVPTATNLPFPAFDKNVDKLPQDKERLLVFYCGGPTCSMSPKSAEKAKALGYTNVKVYHDGMPAWSSAHPGALTTKFLKEAWLDKEIPLVILDARPASQAAKGFIQGAVAAPSAKKRAIAQLKLPPAEKKPPIVVYDEGKGEAAAALARQLVAAGYSSVRVLEGGFAAWQQAQYAAATGALAKTAKWAPKPKMGEIAWDEFLLIAKAVPEDVLVLDVRNEDEVKQWMIAGAKNVPAEDLEKHLGEIPQDKRIVTYCATGVRGEMAYHVLKDKGYQKVSFVNANVQVGKDGDVKLSR